MNATGPGATGPDSRGLSVRGPAVGRRRLATAPRPWRQRMVGRDVDDHERASTNLELLFDLTFVVAVAQIARTMAEHLSEGRVGSGLEGYICVFFAVWWAWVNFTWFASAFDTDDVPYRLLTLVQMSGVLVLAAGVPQAFEGDFTAATIGYVVMRVAMIAQWLRAAGGDPGHRSTCLRYAAAVAVVQVGWVARLALPGREGTVGFVVLVVAELAAPYWAERPGMTSWHPSHIAERYGLFTIIVLGEGIAQVGSAIQTSFTAGGVTARLVVTAGEGLVALFAMWWMYFAREAGDALRERPQLAFFWGYGHYFVFASAAAVAAGIDVAIAALGASSGAADATGATDTRATDTRAVHAVAVHDALSPVATALVVAVPLAVFLVATGIMLGVLHRDVVPKLARVSAAAAATVLAALLAAWLPLLLVGAFVVLPTVVLVADEIVVADRRARRGAALDLPS